MTVIVVALALVAPVQVPVVRCQTRSCEARVQHRRMRRAVKPYRPWLDRLAMCENSGRLRGGNGSHWGPFQFDLQTWLSVGGPAPGPWAHGWLEHRYRAVLLRRTRGTQPWECKV